MRLATILVGIVALTTTTADAAQWSTDAKVMWGACARAFEPQTTPQIGFAAGLCYGTVNAVIFMKDKNDICMPKDVSPEQAQRVVLRYFETHPELLHHDGVTLIHEALHEAWPCR